MGMRRRGGRSSEREWEEAEQVGGGGDLRERQTLREKICVGRIRRRSDSGQAVLGY
jgi:hypothetical protein